jgi:flagellar hook-associated protein 2
VTVSVTSNHNTAKSKMEGFVEAYNSVVKSMNSLQSYNSESGAAGNLLGDNTTNILRSSMRRMIFTSVNGVSSNASSLSRLGVEIEETGLLSFNSATFTTAMETNPEDVKNFFTADTATTKGLAIQFDSFISGYMGSKKGILAAKIDGYTASSKSLDSNIARIERRLVTHEESLRRQFTNLEKLMSTFSSTASYMDSQLSALSNMTSKFK